MTPPRISSKKPQGAASPPNLKAKASDIVAPPPIVPPIVPPPIFATSTPGLGANAFAGASTVRGPGTGSGGQGTGTGSGDNGDGVGGGDETPPLQIKGRLKDSDYPHAAGDLGVGGTVSVRFTVTTDGRATECRVTRSSGSAVLDETTCRLIEQRFRYEPSHDTQGHAVESELVEDHTWVVHDEPPSRD
ncbi:MAG: energy transducer TonB [Sphingomonadaceae bacterium]|nr:energy transducer TonB [Sphingomonadaceae bacterium]